ncbi:MAG: nuclear transport factor 2 family protein [Nocardioidaceae bacterium]
MTNEQAARAFSGHRFEEIYDRLAAHATWTLVGEARLNGRDAIIGACQGTAKDNADVETSWLRFVSTGTGDVVAVDAIGCYVGPDGVSTVSSCDIYEFDDDLIAAITSYAVELPAEDPPAAGDATTAP